jgi:predicted RNA-binding Zn-ribbon protein involved in translation (DUF1610 family)
MGNGGVLFRMRMLTLATFHDKAKAEAIHDRLAQAGLPTKLQDERNIQRFWFLSKPMAAHKVRVSEEDFERGKALLKELDLQEGILDDAVRCPQCGGSQIEYPQTTRKFFIPTLVEVMLTTHLVPKEYYCETCQFTWPSTFEAPPPNWGSENVDALGWKRDKQAH